MRILYRETVDYFLQELSSKGFKLREEAIKFIDFGQKYTQSPDYLVNLAIEITLKAQREFDGSYFIALLEVFTEKGIKDRKQAYQFATQSRII